MKTILAIGLVLVFGGVFLLLTETDKLSGVVLLVVGLSPYTLCVSKG